MKHNVAYPLLRQRTSTRLQDVACGFLLGLLAALCAALSVKP